MKMQNAEITFITFDAQDVIATSGFSYFRLNEINGFKSFNFSSSMAAYKTSSGSAILKIENLENVFPNNYYKLNDGHFQFDTYVSVNATELGANKPNGGTQITTWAGLVDWVSNNSSFLR